MKSSPAVVALITAIAMPIVVVAILGGGTTPAQAAPGGFGVGLKPQSVPTQYAALVQRAGSLCVAAPPSVIAAQIEQESGWNPKAVSPAGAQGISQFLPSTWSSWSKPGESPFDPAAAIPAQGRYDCAIAAQMQAWQADGRLPAALSVTSLMLAGYNAGSGAVLAAGGIPENGQTPDYVSRITARAAYFADTTGAVAAGGPFAAAVVAAARSQIGPPYSWVGGSYTGPTPGVCGPGGAYNDCHIVGFDCSGLVMFAVYQASRGRIRLDHFSETQVRGNAVTYGAGLVARGQEQPGDVIAFTNPGESVSHHVGIYIGNHQMIDAPQSGQLVGIHDLTDGYYQAQQWRVVRYR